MQLDAKVVLYCTVLYSYCTYMHYMYIQHMDRE